MADSNGKLLRNIVWTTFISLILGSYGWTVFTSNSIAKEVINNDRMNASEHREIRTLITNYIMPLREDMASVKTALGIKDNDR